MQSFFVLLLFTIGLADLFFSGQMGIAPIALLYAGLQAQANHAAAKFMRYGLVWPEAPFPETIPPPRPEVKKPFREGKVLNFIPLDEAKKKSGNQAPKQRPNPAPRPIPDPLPKAPFPAPNFRGRPHEVLGVPENAVTQVIVRAFRHWIKRYHPDRAHTPTATEKARQLTAAKESLLQKRQQMRGSNAA